MRQTVEGPRLLLCVLTGIRFLRVGKISSPDKEAAKQSVAALVQVLLGFGDPDCDVVADPGGWAYDPFERYHAFADDTVVVVGPACDRP